MEDFVIDEPRSSTVDDLVDEILPEGLDWQRLVRAYPLPALLVAAVGGFLIGRSHGPSIVSAVSGFAAAEISKNVSTALGRELG
jgi:1,4-dihydroxy-2-naphthoyl-CoA synthase